MTRNKLIRAFLTEYPQLAKQMQSTNHSSESSINPYHGENSVWTHVMMVLTHINCQPYTEPEKTILLYVGLLHDIGKVNACKYNEARDRYSFHGHEGYSFFLAYDIIDKLHKYVPCPDKHLVLKLIALHGQFIEESDFKHLLQFFRIADKSGAVRSEETMLADEVKLDQYDEPNYYPAKPSTKSCTFLCGLPNTGKSTYISNNSFDYVISRDRCIEELYFNKYSSSASYNIMYDIIVNNHKDELDKYFQKSIQEARNHNHIAVDMTMLSLKARRSMMYNLPGYSFSCILFIRSLNDIKANQRPDKLISDSVYNYMMPTFTYPQIQEGFTSITLKDFPCEN